MSEAEAAAEAARVRVDRYRDLAIEIAAVLEGEPDRGARMATVVAMLVQAFGERFFWTGFYVVDARRPEELVVGPYQGALGCLRIAVGRGVCGQAALHRRPLIVPDVDAHPDHIACDSRSRSEIVLPVFDAEDRLIAVLDVDSTQLDAFDEVDARGLGTILRETFARRTGESIGG